MVNHGLLEGDKVILNDTGGELVDPNVSSFRNGDGSVSIGVYYVKSADSDKFSLSFSYDEEAIGIYSDSTQPILGNFVFNKISLKIATTTNEDGTTQLGIERTYNGIGDIPEGSIFYLENHMLENGMTTKLYLTPLKYYFFSLYNW